MARVTLPLVPPPGFSLRATIKSHGWSDLAPFRAGSEGEFLEIRLGRTIATVRGDEVLLESERPLGGDARAHSLFVVRSCLRFELDLTLFWELCRSDPELEWAAQLGAGRFLRAPTVFGDALMVLATTNCSWALTKKMVATLAQTYGVRGALPEAAALARVHPDSLRTAAPVGYRAPYFISLARSATLEPLRADASGTDALRARLMELPGFGPYAAENLLRLLGRFEHLAVDSWVRRIWRERHPRRACTEFAIARHFARYGVWRGLAFWLSLTRPWYEPGGPRP